MATTSLIDLGNSAASRASPLSSISLGNPTQEAVDLAATLNPLYVQNFKMAMEAVSPGSSGVVADNIGSLLKGEIPLDMQKQLMQSSAELNLTQGRFGEAANFSTMRTLGKTSYDLQQQGLANLKSMMPALPDIATLIQNQRAYDTQKANIQLQESQFERTQAQQLSEFTATNALQKLQLTLQQQQEAFKEQETTATDAWDKQLSAYNQQFEKWAISEQRKQAADVLAAKQNVANQTAAATLAAQQSRTAANTATTIPTAATMPAVATTPAAVVSSSLGSELSALPAASSVLGTTPSLADLTFASGAEASAGSSSAESRGGEVDPLSLSMFGDSFGFDEESALANW